MSSYRPASVSSGAWFVNEHGMGPADRPFEVPDYRDLPLDEVALRVHLADVTALAELLVEELASATGEHERQILFRLQGEG